MIHPSQILNFKNRIIVEFLVKNCKIKYDTFVYLCRDFGLTASSIRFLIEYYYHLERWEAKKIALSSTAWGEMAHEMMRLDEEFLDFLEEEQIKQEAKRPF